MKMIMNSIVIECTYKVLLGDSKFYISFVSLYHFMIIIDADNNPMNVFLASIMKLYDLLNNDYNK